MRMGQRPGGAQRIGDRTAHGKTLLVKHHGGAVQNVLVAVVKPFAAGDVDDQRVVTFDMNRRCEVAGQYRQRLELLPVGERIVIERGKLRHERFGIGQRLPGAYTRLGRGAIDMHNPKHLPLRRNRRYGV